MTIWRPTSSPLIGFESRGTQYEVVGEDRRGRGGLEEVLSDVENGELRGRIDVIVELWGTVGRGELSWQFPRTDSSTRRYTHNLLSSAVLRLERAINEDLLYARRIITSEDATIIK